MMETGEIPAEVNVITLYDRAGRAIRTLVAEEVALTFSGPGLPVYDDEEVAWVEATFDAAPLRIYASGSGLAINDVRATASAVDVASHMSWGYPPVGSGWDLTLTFTAPEEAGDSMSWDVGYEAFARVSYGPGSGARSFRRAVAPIKLKVRITRREGRPCAAEMSYESARRAVPRRL